MEEESGFDSVQWDRNEHPPLSPAGQPYEEASLPHRSLSERRLSSNSSEPQVSNNADEVEVPGLGMEGTLECSVDSPTKENDGTKDAYVSYKVTTHVCASSCSAIRMRN